MKRRDFSKQLAGAGLGLAWAAPALAQGGAPIEGQHFVRLSTPVPVSLPGPDKKIEVIEFFWYGCPACYAFEPAIDAWSRRLPPDVAFRQVHVGYSPQVQMHQKLFFALEEMGQLATMNKRVFAAIHQQNRRLTSESEIMTFVTSSGLDGAKFADAFKSFGVNTKINRAKQLTAAYKIDGVPALGINGRFYTSGSLAGSNERSLAVADFLIQRSRQQA